MAKDGGGEETGFYRKVDVQKKKGKGQRKGKRKNNKMTMLDTV